VNKQNPAIEFYKRQGFSILSENVFELEKGFVMDDYIMGINL
jgi:ribosomal protein S18 acetylase RimI-like enzyme